MSKVISFRLNKSNPMEARALETLNDWISNGYSARFIIVKALLKLSCPSPGLTRNCSGCDLDLVLSQLSYLITIVESSESSSLTHQTPNNELPVLKENFIASIKIGVKPGIRSD